MRSDAPQTFRTLSTTEENRIPQSKIHTIGFCKGANSGVKSLYPDIADADGKLDKQKLCRNANMRTMILDGWTWVLLPEFARLGQQALNLTNKISSQVGYFAVAVNSVE